MLLMMTQFINYDIIIICKTFAVDVSQSMELPAWLQIMVGGVTFN